MFPIFNFGHHIIILIVMTIEVTATVETRTCFQIYIFSIFAVAGITTVATKTHPVHKSILNLVPRLFLCKFVIYDPGSIWERNMLFPIIPDSMLSGRTEKYSSSSPQKYICVGKYRNTAVRMFIATGREIFRDTNFYKLCFMPFATQGRFRLPY